MSPRGACAGGSERRPQGRAQNAERRAFRGRGVCKAAHRGGAAGSVANEHRREFGRVTARCLRGRLGTEAARACSKRRKAGFSRARCLQSCAPRRSCWFRSERTQTGVWACHRAVLARAARNGGRKGVLKTPKGGLFAGAVLANPLVDKGETANYVVRGD